jgi:putative transposase
MALAPSPLTSLSQEQQTQATSHLTTIRPALEKEITQAEIAHTHQISLRTVQRWIKSYREQGLTGLADPARADKRTSRKFSQTALRLIEGLALQTPPRSAASIHRQISAIATEQGWQPPGYTCVYTLSKKLDPALVTLAHQGAAVYREAFALLYRRESTHSNAMWQAGHVVLLDEAGKPARPWLTVIEDDYSRAIASFRLTFQEPTALTTALALRHAIWRKADPHWHVCGIPSVFYTDHGSDLASKQMEQVALDLGIKLIFSEKGVPRGRGKIERFFRSMNELFLQDIPGYAPKGYQGEAMLSLSAFEHQFQTWLLSDSEHRVHSETRCKPASRWEAGRFVPRMPDSAERLDLLLLTVAKTRRVQQDGIRFQNYRSLDTTLAAGVKEEVLIRYAPADLAEIHVFYQKRFLCRTICQELVGQTVSLKAIAQARDEHRKQVRAGLSAHAAGVEHFLAIHQTKEPGVARTREYLHFGEFCDVCRKYRYIGICHSVPETGKTRIAHEYARWDTLSPFFAEELFALVGRRYLEEQFPHQPLATAGSPACARVLSCRPASYTAPVVAPRERIEREVMALSATLSYVVEAAEQASRGKDDFLLAYRQPKRLELVIVDKVQRLEMAGLEQLRDLSDRENAGVVLMGQPGLEKILARYPQLYSRVRFAHQFHLLSEKETRWLLEQRWSRLGGHMCVNDFTDQAALAVVRIPGGNVRVIHRLLMQIEHVLEINHPAGGGQGGDGKSPRKTDLDRSRASMSCLNIVSFFGWNVHHTDLSSEFARILTHAFLLLASTLCLYTGFSL